MQTYFSEQAPTYSEAERIAREKHGDRIIILTHEAVKIRRGPFNLFYTEGVKISGIISKNRVNPYNQVPVLTAREIPPQKETLDFNEAKQKVLALANSTTQKDSGISLKEVLAGIKNLNEKLDSSG